VIYAIGEVSECPVHQYCAYTGDERDERDRCPNCHRLLGLCDDDSCGGLPRGRHSPCLCMRCKELFTSVTSFDLHLGALPDMKCRAPEQRGLVLYDQGGWSLWGKPGSPPPREAEQ
jgi:hypothetical protein